MMRKFTSCYINRALRLSLVLLLLASVLPADALNPKREFRSTFLTTVRNVDWPSYKGMGAASMQTEMMRLLDSIQSLNLNTVLFQVRCNSDAFYKSEYEPWSDLLTGTRGKDPGFDPLEMWITECHKRGMQLHAWVNPYRYNNRAGNGYGWTGTNDIPENYEHTHPEWVLYFPNRADPCAMLDPGNPEVRLRVKQVIGDIINHYDVDGIHFDDYFYPYGGTTVQDTMSQRLYKPAGMVVQDWRRDNVRKMMQDVYDTIQAVNPNIAFGVSPFGTWTNDSYVARMHDIVLPKGVSSPANMYSEIYCDPITWLEDGSIDYIAPQLYWPTTHSANPYDKLCPWWADIANRFNRHFYSSMSTDSYSRGVSGFTMLEMRTETDINRNSSKDGAFGFVFFHTKGWVYDTKFRYQFGTTRLTCPALPPAVNYKPANILPPVEDLQLNGQTLTWQAVKGSNIRYAVYAVPRTYADTARVFSRSDVLLGISFTNEYTLPNKINATDYRIAVSVLDGCWNEFSLRVLDEQQLPQVSASLTYPLGSEAELSWSQLCFSWTEVPDAFAYQIQIARDADFQDILAAQELTDTTFNAELRLNLYRAGVGDYYWRVRTLRANMQDTWSTPVRFTINSTAILSAVETAQASIAPAKKIVENGNVYVLHAGKRYNLLGQEIKNGEF